MGDRMMRRNPPHDLVLKRNDSSASFPKIINKPSLLPATINGLKNGTTSPVSNGPSAVSPGRIRPLRKPSIDPFPPTSPHGIAPQAHSPRVKTDLGPLNATTRATPPPLNNMTPPPPLPHPHNTDHPISHHGLGTGGGGGHHSTTTTGGGTRNNPPSPVNQLSQLLANSNNSSVPTSVLSEQLLSALHSIRGRSEFTAVEHIHLTQLANSMGMTVHPAPTSAWSGAAGDSISPPPKRFFGATSPPLGSTTTKKSRKSHVTVSDDVQTLELEEIDFEEEEEEEVPPEECTAGQQHVASTRRRDSSNSIKGFDMKDIKELDDGSRYRSSSPFMNSSLAMQTQNSTTAHHPPSHHAHDHRVERRYIFANTRADADELLRVVLELATTVYSNVDTAQAIVTELDAIVDVDESLLFDFDDGKLCTAYSRDGSYTVEHLEEYPLVRQCVEICTKDYLWDSDLVISEDEAGSDKSLIVVPVAINGRLQGILQLNRFDTPFTKRDEHIITAFCTFAAVFMHNARSNNDVFRQQCNVLLLLDCNRRLCNNEFTTLQTIPTFVRMAKHLTCSDRCIVYIVRHLLNNPIRRGSRTTTTTTSEKEEGMDDTRKLTDVRIFTENESDNCTIFKSNLQHTDCVYTVFSKGERLVLPDVRLSNISNYSNTNNTTDETSSPSDTAPSEASPPTNASTIVTLHERDILNTELGADVDDELPTPAAASSNLLSQGGLCRWKVTLVPVLQDSQVIAVFALETRCTHRDLQSSGGQHPEIPDKILSGFVSYISTPLMNACAAIANKQQHYTFYKPNPTPPPPTNSPHPDSATSPSPHSSHSFAGEGVPTTPTSTQALSDNLSTSTADQGVTDGENGNNGK